MYILRWEGKLAGCRFLCLELGQGDVQISGDALLVLAALWAWEFFFALKHS